MREMDIVNEDELESQTLRKNPNKSDERKPSGDDPISDYLLKMYYKLGQKNMSGVRVAICATPFVLILAFYLFVSNTTSNIIAFTALVISLVFMGISMWILCWILDKDQGTRAM